MTRRSGSDFIAVSAPSVQVTSGAATALITLPNDSSGNVAKYVHVCSKSGVYILPHLALFATGSIDLTGLPANNETLTVNGTVITFKTSGAAGPQINIAATTALMAEAIYNFLTASADANIDDARYTYDFNQAGRKVTVTHRVAGTAGNAFTLTEAAANLTVSGATLAGGAQTAATAGTSLYLVAGESIRLYTGNINAISYIQETSASIINITPVEHG